MHTSPDRNSARQFLTVRALLRLQFSFELLFGRPLLVGVSRCQSSLVFRGAGTESTGLIFQKRRMETLKNDAKNNLRSDFGKELLLAIVIVH